MRRTPTLLLLTSITTALLAQPSFQFANYPTGPLTFTVYSMVDEGGTQPPTNGPDQTWQYSAITWTQAGTAVLDDAAGTPYATDYPGANVTWTMTPTGGDPEFQYNLVSSAGFEVLATHIPAAPNIYSDPQRVIQFPWTFNTSFFDSYVSPSNSGSASWTYDGYGTFITSLGTFTDQMKATSTDGDVIFWNASPLYPTLIADGSSVMLFVLGANAVSELEPAAPLKAHPNPCASYLNVQNMPAGSWRIQDLAGRTVLTGRSSGAMRQQLEVRSLNAGSYVILCAGNLSPLKFIKE